MAVLARARKALGRLSNDAIMPIKTALFLLTFRESPPIGALVDGHAVRRSLWKPCLRRRLKYGIQVIMARFTGKGGFCSD